MSLCINKLNLDKSFNLFLLENVIVFLKSAFVSFSLFSLL